MEQAVTTLNNVRNWAQEQLSALDDRKDGACPIYQEHYLDGKQDALIELMQILGYRRIDGAWVQVVTDANGSTDCE